MSFSMAGNVAFILLVLVHSRPASMIADCSPGGECLESEFAAVCLNGNDCGVISGQDCDGLCHQYCGEGAEWNGGPWVCDEGDTTKIVTCRCTPDGGR